METLTYVLQIIIISVTLFVLIYYAIEWIYTQIKVVEFLENLRFNSKYHVDRYDRNNQGYYLSTVHLDHHVFKIGSKSETKLKEKINQIELDYVLLKNKRNHIIVALRKRLRFNLR